MNQTVHSFEELAQVMGVKVRKIQKPAVRKCNSCGGAMKQVAENVWYCPFNKLSIEKLVKDDVETEVQVFEPCENYVIANISG